MQNTTLYFSEHGSFPGLYRKRRQRPNQYFGILCAAVNDRHDDYTMAMLRVADPLIGHSDPNRKTGMKNVTCAAVTFRK